MRLGQVILVLGLIAACTAARGPQGDGKRVGKRRSRGVYKLTQDGETYKYHHVNTNEPPISVPVQKARIRGGDKKEDIINGLVVAHTTPDGLLQGSKLLTRMGEEPDDKALSEGVYVLTIRKKDGHIVFHTLSSRDSHTLAFPQEQVTFTNVEGVDAVLPHVLSRSGAVSLLPKEVMEAQTADKYKKQIHIRTFYVTAAVLKMVKERLAETSTPGTEHSKETAPTTGKRNGKIHKVVKGPTTTTADSVPTNRVGTDEGEHNRATIEKTKKPGKHVNNGKPQQPSEGNGKKRRGGKGHDNNNNTAILKDK